MGLWNRAGKSSEKEEAGSSGSAGEMWMGRLCDVQGQALGMCPAWIEVTKILGRAGTWAQF